MPKARVSRAHPGQGAAQAVVRRLAQAEVADALALDEEEVAQLRRIAQGRPPRNAQSILKAIELKLSWAYSKPKQTVEAHVTLEQLVLGSYQAPSSTFPQPFPPEPELGTAAQAEPSPVAALPAPGPLGQQGEVCPEPRADAPAGPASPPLLRRVE